MATVYLAEDVKHERQVAVKVLRPELAAVLGETLRDKLNRETQLSIDEAVSITTAIADALDYAHRNNVIHRDIKPENLLLHDGRPMVADFGIALAVSAAAGGRMTETGLSLGTPHYMSPEQATAEKDLTNRSDIYSLGSVLYEMLTGEPPHIGGSAQAIIMKIVTDDARPVTELRKSVPPHVAAATAKSLERLAADRFESAAKFAEALTNPAFTLPTTQAAVAGAPASGSWNRLSIGFAVFAGWMTVTTLWGWLRPQPEVPKPVSRYSVALPEEEALFNGLGSRVAVSPDGSRLVYVGAGEQNSRLLVRDLDQLRATPLPGTDNASQPFFSPDGSRVGFYVGGTENEWRVASLGGGPPITIADSGTGWLGGSWGPDGYLYFDGTLPGSGLVRVAEGGGAPEAVTMRDTTQGEEAHIWPEALPGGHGVVFTALRGGWVSFAEWDIAVVDVGTGTHSVLLRGVRARYAASGHLVYVTADGTLMAVPFDETTLAVTGDAVALVEGLRVGFVGIVDLAVSATGTLFYTSGDVYGGGLGEVVWVTRDGTAEEIDPDWTADFLWPKLSPDGMYLAVGITANDELQIWIKELDRGPFPKLTFTGSLNQRPAWTPDGRSVAFSSNRGDNLDLYVRRADGTGQPQLLLDEERPLEEVTYSPDGEWLVYREGGEDRKRDLYARRMGSDTATALVVTEYDETSPAVSPDGRWLAYVSNESGRYEVYVRPFPNTNDGRWQVSTDGGVEPVWAHSGRELFYKGSGNLIVVEVLPGATFVTGERGVLFSTQRFGGSNPIHQSYDVTLDDQRFVMIRSPNAEANQLIVVENFFEELKAKVGN